jgi:hypothetical protein
MIMAIYVEKVIKNVGQSTAAEQARRILQPADGA